MYVWYVTDVGALNLVEGVELLSDKQFVQPYTICSNECTNGRTSTTSSTTSITQYDHHINKTTMAIPVKKMIKLKMTSKKKSLEEILWKETKIKRYVLVLSM
jgi:hypothetical protein